MLYPLLYIYPFVLNQNFLESSYASRGPIKNLFSLPWLQSKELLPAIWPVNSCSLAEYHLLFHSAAFMIQDSFHNIHLWKSEVSILIYKWKRISFPESPHDVGVPCLRLHEAGPSVLELHGQGALQLLLYLPGVLGNLLQTEHADNDQEHPGHQKLNPGEISSKPSEVSLKEYI